MPSRAFLSLPLPVFVACHACAGASSSRLQPLLIHPHTRLAPFSLQLTGSNSSRTGDQPGGTDLRLNQLGNATVNRCMVPQIGGYHSLLSKQINWLIRVELVDCYMSCIFHSIAFKCLTWTVSNVGAFDTMYLLCAEKAKLELRPASVPFKSRTRGSLLLKLQRGMKEEGNAGIQQLRVTPNHIPCWPLALKW